MRLTKLKNYRVRANKNEIIDHLLKVKRKINLFNDLTDYQIKTLVKEITFNKFKKNETIFRQGDTKNQFIYFILAGSVKVVLKDNFGIRKTITTVSQGSIIGEIQAILEQERTASCVASSDSNILIGFTINDYNTTTNGNIYGIFYRNLSRVLAHKIADTNTKVK